MTDTDSVDGPTDDEREPSGLDDSVTGLSRREVLVAGGTGALAGLTGLAGCIGGSSGGDGGDPITVGLQADLTGALASYGFWHERVLRGYVSELNANGGIAGRDVELVVEDTATDAKQGVSAMRTLVQSQSADFVIGSQSSGVSIATNSVAKQLDVPYFPLGEAPSITGADGNRWVIRNNHNVTQAAIVAARHGLSNLGSKWTIVYQDYAFGKQYRDAVRTELEANGGEVLTTIPVQVGTNDLAPHLAKVPDDTEVLFNALIGGSAQSFLRQSADMDVPGARLGPIASVEGVGVGGLGPGAEGASYVTMLPRELSEFDTPGNRHLREVARVDETDEVLVGGHYFVSYEALSWIADAVTATGWESAEDHQTFVEWFEDGPAVEGSEAYPQGTKFFRGTDHLAFMNLFVEEIRDGSLRVVHEEEVTEPTFPPAADLAGQSF